MKVEALARNSSMLRRALRTRSQRVCIAMAIFFLILVVVLAIFGAAMAKNTIRFDEFEQRLRSLEKIEDIYKKLHDIEKQIEQEKT